MVQPLLLVPEFGVEPKPLPYESSILPLDDSGINNLVYKPVEKQVRYYYTYFNKKLFSVKLPTSDEIQIEFLKSAEPKFAEVEYKNQKYILYIQRKYQNSYFFKCILLHEMIHIWQHLRYGTMDHGETFWNWERKLLDFGFFLKDKY